MRRLVPIAVVLAAILLAGGALRAAIRARSAERARVAALLDDARRSVAEGDSEAGRRRFAEYLGQRPDDGVVRREYAGLLLADLQADRLKGKSLNNALAVLERVLRDAPDDHWLRFRLARWMVANRTPVPAIDHLEKLRQSVGPEPVPAPSADGTPVTRRDLDLLFAEALDKAGRFEEAVDRFAALVDFDPRSRSFPEPAPSPDAGAAPPAARAPSRAYEALARLLEKEFTDEAAAARVVERNTVVNADDASAWMSFAAWHNARETDPEGVAAAIEKAASLDPDHPLVLRSLCLKAIREKRYDDALQLARRGADLHPRESWPYTERAKIATRTGDIDGAVDALVTPLARGIGGQPMLQALVVLPNEQPWHEAIARRLPEIDGVLLAHQPFRLALEARSLMSRHRWIEAVGTLEAARALGASLQRLKGGIDTALASCHEALGAPDLQFAAAERARQETTNASDGRLSVAEALLACGRPGAALPLFRRVAAALSDAELARRPEVWVPLMRLEAASGVTGSGDGRRDPAAIAAAIGPTLPPRFEPLLRAETLAAGGNIDGAATALATAPADGPEDAPLVASRIVMLGRAGRGGEVPALFAALPAAIADSAVVLSAAAEACRTLPPAEGGALAEALHEARPDDLRMALEVLRSRLRGGDRAGVAAVAATIASLAGAESHEAAYARGAAWMLGAVRDEGASADDPPWDAAVIRQKLATVETLRPEWTDLLCLLAEIDLRDGRTKEAIERFQRALQTRPADGEIGRRLALLLAGSGRFAEGEKVLSGLDRADRERFGRIAAEMTLRAGKRDEGLALAERAAESGSDDPDDLLWLADVLAANGRHDRAVAALERGLVVAPARVDLWLVLADLHASRGDAESVDTLLERAAREVPGERRPLVQAEADRLAGRTADAVATYRSLVGMQPPDLLCLRRAAECFRAAGLTDEAGRTLDTMLSLRGGGKADEEALRWARRQSAETRLRDGSLPLATEALRSLRDVPADEDSLSAEDAGFAAAILARRPEPQSWRMALGLLERIGKRQAPSLPETALAARMRGRIGDWQRARDQLLSLTEKPDMPAEIHAALIDIFLVHDDPKSAARSIDALVALAPDDPETIVLEARLALARSDKPAAVAAAKRLMPEGEATAADLPALLATSATMEELGFQAAANSLVVRAAAVADSGVMARVAFLLRRNRDDEAREVIAAARSAGAADGPYDVLDALLATRCEQAGEGESLSRRLFNEPAIPYPLKTVATARLASCLIAAGRAQTALEVADRAVIDLGPHPDLLDARGLANLELGDTSAAVRDFTEANLVPTPERLLHLAHAKSIGTRPAEARDIMERLERRGFDPQSLRPVDRSRLEFITRRIASLPR